MAAAAPRDDFSSDDTTTLKLALGVLVGSSIICNEDGTYIGERTFIRKTGLSGAVLSGATTINVDNSVELDAGEKILLTSSTTSQRDPRVGREYCTVAEKVSGTIITLTAPVSQDFEEGADVDRVYESFWTDNNLPADKLLEDPAQEKVYPRLR